MAQRRSFLTVGLIAWAFLTLFVGWVLISPTNPLTNMYRAPIQKLSDNIVAGPYPVAGDFNTLHTSGVTTDISLLDPKIPYEHVLLNREKKNAEAQGIKFMDFPIASIMGQKFGSYYETNVQRAASAIDSLSKSGEKVYLHCYLGEHRMVAVKKALAERGVIAANDTLPSKTSASMLMGH